jgi:hypothetical protein
MSNVYRKTERGQTEIATRQFKLAPRLRSALVVVDGKRSQFELAAMIAGEPQETLQALLEAGFIELAEAASPPQMPLGPGGLAVDLPILDVLDDELADDEASTGYAPTQPLEQFLAAPTPAVAAPRPVPPRPAMPAGAAHNLETTKRHAVQWLSQQLGPYAEGANRRIERCDTAEALGSAILVARSVVEQQLGAQAANTFEAEMFAALRRGAAG